MNTDVSSFYETYGSSLQDIIHKHTYANILLYINIYSMNCGYSLMDRNLKLDRYTLLARLTYIFFPYCKLFKLSHS